MVMIDSQNLSSILGKKGVRLCSGLSGKKCWRPRRDKGRLCLECHRDSMRALRAKGKSRVAVEDGYNFNQENYVG